MTMWQVYIRVVGLLGPEKRLAMLLAAANLALAMIALLEPWLFGHVIDAFGSRFRPIGSPTGAAWP